MLHILRMHFGIGMKGIRQIEAKALRKLKHPMRSNISEASSIMREAGYVQFPPFRSTLLR